MPKVLVVEDVPDIRLLLVETLADAGFQVIQAADGSVALEKASHERPDVVLLDVMMPVMDGFEVLAKLRQDPATRNIPVVMLTSLSALEGEKRGMDLGVTHYLTKPLDLGVLGATLRVILRERLSWAGKIGDGQAGASVLQTGAAAPANPQTFSPGGKNTVVEDGGEKSDGELGKSSRFIRTGDKLVALGQRLGGGLPLGSLTLVEGAVSSGKSVLCQHLVFGALTEGLDTAYFTSEYSREGLVGQMRSLGLDVSDPSLTGRLHVQRIPEPDEDESPEPILADLVREMEALPVTIKFIVVDAITDLVNSTSEDAVIAFFTACRRMCNRGKTVVVVIHSYAFAANAGTFKRIHSVWDGHLSLWSETVGGKAVRTVEVQRVNSKEVDDNNTVTFEVVPNLGMRVLPVSRGRG
jgi:flagellar protein FlaH